MPKNEGSEIQENYMKYEKFLSETDKKYFDAIASNISVKQAALRLGILPQTLYNWKFDLLNRRVPLAIGFLKCVSLQKFRSGLLRRVLTQRVEINAEKEFEELSKIEKMGMVLPDQLDNVEEY